jgi:hypothetical protein
VQTHFACDDTTMSDLASTSPQSLLIPKLCDDRSNWADYEPRARRAIGSKGLVPYLEGYAKVPVAFNKVNGIPQYSQWVVATEYQVETRERKIQDHERNEYLAQHLILSSTSPQLSSKILQPTTAKEMWDAVTLDATKKSTFHQVDVLTQLQTMRCPALPDLEIHLAEVKAHFAKMMEHFEYL